MLPTDTVISNLEDLVSETCATPFWTLTLMRCIWESMKDLSGPPIDLRSLSTTDLTRCRLSLPPSTQLTDSLWMLSFRSHFTQKVAKSTNLLPLSPSSSMLLNPSTTTISSSLSVLRESLMLKTNQKLLEMLKWQTSSTHSMSPPTMNTKDLSPSPHALKVSHTTLSPTSSLFPSFNKDKCIDSGEIPPDTMDQTKETTEDFSPLTVVKFSLPTTRCSRTPWEPTPSLPVSPLPYLLLPLLSDQHGTQF